MKAQGLIQGKAKVHEALHTEMQCTELTQLAIERHKGPCLV